MNPHPKEQKGNRVTFEPSTERDSWKPNLMGLRQSEKEAYGLILELIEQEHMSKVDKMNFLRALETLSGAVRAQTNGDMNDYYPKTILAKKIETFLLEESTEILDNNVRQQAMLCTVALSQVKPPFHLSQKLDLVTAGISSVFSLPLIVPSLDRRDSASLYLQTAQALDDMLQALTMDDLCPNMLILEKFIEIILPWLTLSDKVYEKTRALGTISRLLRFACNFPELSNMMLFSLSGKLMGILGLFCVHSNAEISTGASEALHYLFKILVLQRSSKHKTEIMLKELQKHFRREWFASMQDLTLFFRKYLTPTERADVIMLAMEAMTSSNSHNIRAASKVLRMILKSAIPEISKVSEIIQYIYTHLSYIRDTTAQSTVKKVFYLLIQSYPDEVILTLFKMQDQSQKGICKPWEILASFPKGYEVVMEYLLQRLTPHLAPKEQKPSHGTELSPLIATRAIYELLLEPSRRLEVQTFFASLFIGLLFRLSSLMVEERAETTQDRPRLTEWVEPVSFVIKALKILMSHSGYEVLECYIQKLGAWELLVSPETHYEGVSLLASCLVTKNCWHNRPIFSILIKTLQDLDFANHLTALVFLTELLQCPDVSDTVDEIATHILANWFKCEELVTVKLLLHLTEVFAKPKNLVRRLHILQPHVLSWCYSSNRDVVMETFLTLHNLLQDLTWQHSSSFLIQITFTLASFFEEESEDLRLLVFQIYGNLLAKVTRRVFVFPLRHQVLDLVVMLVLHLKDENTDVGQICRLSLYYTASILGWSKLKAVFIKKDVFIILGALLQQKRNKALWFLKQCVGLFKSPQVHIRQAAVWFAGQILQTLNLEERDEIEEAYLALRSMQRDPDSMVSCLSTQIFYILNAREKLLQVKTPTSCLCWKRPLRWYF
ncbi:maestro heat-like repeat-containing protein family member 7 [Castor canadensis]|uniref:Maestro heat-like repeat-containing protein family member 7 n=2 Tax=Castor canadensis TaxID=51338 RepID=A0AC58KIN1_CASCN